MFDVEIAVTAWRARLAETGSLFEADLDELESHLRDHLEALEEVGLTGEEAFRTAAERLGETSTLAAEFAKVNPLLAWRAALFWICAGTMMATCLRPVEEVAQHAAVAICVRLHLGQPLVSVVMWTVVFVAPMAVLAGVFPYARRTLDKPLHWARRPITRIAVIVGGAVSLLVSHLGVSWGLLSYFERHWEGETVAQAWRAASHADYTTAVAALLLLGGIAARQRSLVMKNRAESAPLFWLAVGLFVGAVRCQLHYFVREAAFAGGGFAHLSPEHMRTFMWLVTLGCPLLLFASTYAYLRHRAPGPSQLVRARGVLLALACSGAVSIAAVFGSSVVSQRASRLLTFDALVAGHQGWLIAGIVTSCALPVLVGALMFKLRAGAARAARF